MAGNKYGISDALLDTLKGNIVPVEVREERLKKCKAPCEYLILGTTCKLCGCFVDWAARMPGKVCPDNPPRWEAYKKKDANNPT